MVGFQLSETLSESGSVSRGICQTQGDRLLSVEEWTGIIRKNSITGKNSGGHEKVLRGNEIVSMNVWAFPPSAFSFLEDSFVTFLSSVTDPVKSEFYLPAAVDEWISAQKVEVEVRSASCEWIGVTYQEDKPRTVESIAGLVNKGKYPSPLLR